MPQLKNTTAKRKAYGTQRVQNDLTFQERLMKRFAAHEWVNVKNVDNDPIVWQYLPAHLEEHEYTTDPMQITRRGEPEVWQLDPEDTEPIIGASAYIMIEALYKQIVAKKRTLEIKDAPLLGRNFNFSDATQQEFWISKIYQGKAQPFGADVPQLDPNERHPRLTKAPGVGASGGRR